MTNRIDTVKNEKYGLWIETPINSHYWEVFDYNIGFYERGHKEGLWSYYNYDNSIKFTGNYKEGEKNGLWTYYNTGKVDFTENYFRINDRRDSVVISKYSNNILKSIDIYYFNYSPKMFTITDALTGDPVERMGIETNKEFIRSIIH